MSEIERYNGLTTADKPALLDAKLAERNYVVLRDGKIDHFTRELPRFKHHNKFNWEIVAIDLALAQIAEMEAERKPMTVNEWLNQATPEQKAEWLLLQFPYLQAKAINMALRDNINGIFSAEYKRRVAELLNSPYTEGETK